jgi:hypothetical protein
MPLVATSPAKPWRLIAKIGLAAFVLNEVRGIIVVAMSWPIWWPLITGMFHAALRGR